MRKFIVLSILFFGIGYLIWILFFYEETEQTHIQQIPHENRQSVQKSSRLSSERPNEPKVSSDDFLLPNSQVTETKLTQLPTINSYWDQKLVNGYQYTFGTGNPPELAVTQEELEQSRKNPPTEPGFGYVTPEAEQLLLRFLSNPSLPYVVNKCSNEITNADPTVIGRIFQESYLDINQLLVIDKNGRKKIRMERISPLMQRLEYLAFGSADDLWRSCLSDSEFAFHLEGILKDYHDLFNAYYH